MKTECNRRADGMGQEGTRGFRIICLGTREKRLVLWRQGKHSLFHSRLRSACLAYRIAYVSHTCVFAAHTHTHARLRFVSQHTCTQPLTAVHPDTRPV